MSFRLELPSSSVTFRVLLAVVVAVVVTAALRAFT